MEGWANMIRIIILRRESSNTIIKPPQHLGWCKSSFQSFSLYFKDLSASGPVFLTLLSLDQHLPLGRYGCTYVHMYIRTYLFCLFVCLISALPISSKWPEIWTSSSNSLHLDTGLLWPCFCPSLTYRLLTDCQLLWLRLQQKLHSPGTF